VASQTSFLHGWRLSDRQHFRMLGYPGRVDQWAWTPDGSLLATSGAAAAIVWPFDGEGGPMARNAIEVAPRVESVASAVAWHPIARSLAIGYADGAVQLASLKDPLSARLLRESGRMPISSLAWSKDGAKLAFGSAAGECGVMEVRA
jgi:WD40 repeat protein